MFQVTPINAFVKCGLQERWRSCHLACQVLVHTWHPHALSKAARVQNQSRFDANYHLDACHQCGHRHGCSQCKARLRLGLDHKVRSVQLQVKGLLAPNSSLIHSEGTEGPLLPVLLRKHCHNKGCKGRNSSIKREAPSQRLIHCL